jgi:hypothetical protein
MQTCIGADQSAVQKHDPAQLMYFQHLRHVINIVGKDSCVCLGLAIDLRHTQPHLLGYFSPRLQARKFHECAAGEKNETAGGERVHYVVVSSVSSAVYAFASRGSRHLTRQWRGQDNFFAL